MVKYEGEKSRSFRISRREKVAWTKGGKMVIERQGDGATVS